MPLISRIRLPPAPGDGNRKDDLLSVLTAHSLDAASVGLVRDERRWQTLDGFERLSGTRERPVSHAIVLLPVDLDAIDVQLAERDSLRGFLEEALQLRRFIRVYRGELDRIAISRR